MTVSISEFRLDVWKFRVYKIFLTDAIKDLESALQLANGKGKVASQAYCQRAMLHQLSGNTQEAIKDWEAASKLGNSFAKQQLVQFNPYAALCNKMLHEVFQGLKGSS